jgi:hypothetical protein
MFSNNVYRNSCYMFLVDSNNNLHEELFLRSVEFFFKYLNVFLHLFRKYVISTKESTNMNNNIDVNDVFRKLTFPTRIKINNVKYNL